jgi:hypothetical protein
MSATCHQHMNVMHCRQVNATHHRQMSATCIWLFGVREILNAEYGNLPEDDLLEWCGSSGLRNFGKLRFLWIEISQSDNPLE